MKGERVDEREREGSDKRFGGNRRRCERGGKEDGVTGVRGSREIDVEKGVRRGGERWMAVEQRGTHQSLFLQREFILRERTQAFGTFLHQKNKKKQTQH